MAEENGFVSDDDDELYLSELSKSTVLALDEFLKDQAALDQATLREDWQLSQFWYGNDTIEQLSKAAIVQCSDDDAKIALISCPSLYKKIKSLTEMENKKLEVKLFEFDYRFASFKPDYIYYDYNQPSDVDPKYHNYFDVILLDPPFLSEECLTNTSKTVKYLGKEESKIILCTGAVMEEIAGKLLGVQKCSFQPRHKNKLANDFICLTNFGELVLGKE